MKRVSASFFYLLTFSFNSWILCLFPCPTDMVRLCSDTMARSGLNLAQTFTGPKKLRTSSGGSRRGSRAPPPPRLIFRPNWGPKTRKNFIADRPPPSPPLSQGLDPALTSATVSGLSASVTASAFDWMGPIARAESWFPINRRHVELALFLAHRRVVLVQPYPYDQ